MSEKNASEFLRILAARDAKLVTVIGRYMSDHDRQATFSGETERQCPCPVCVEAREVLAS